MPHEHFTQTIFLFLLAPDTAAVPSAEGALDLADVFLVLLYGFLLFGSIGMWG